MLEKTCLVISSRLKRAGGVWGGADPPICNEGAPFEEGCEGDFARDFLLRVGEDTFIRLIIVIVIEIVRKQSVKAEQQRSTKAEKQKERKGRGKQSTRKNNKQSKQGRAASENLKRKAKQTIREAEKQRSKTRSKKTETQREAQQKY